LNNTTQHNTTQHNTTQHNTTQHNTTQHNTTQGLITNQTPIAYGSSLTPTTFNFNFEVTDPTVITSSFASMQFNFIDNQTLTIRCHDEFLVQVPDCDLPIVPRAPSISATPNGHLINAHCVPTGNAAYGNGFMHLGNNVFCTFWSYQSYVQNAVLMPNFLVSEYSDGIYAFDKNFNAQYYKPLRVFTDSALAWSGQDSAFGLDVKQLKLMPDGNLML